MNEQILLVYPDEELRLGCKAVLNLRGVSARCAASSEEASKLMNRYSFDAIVSGVGLKHTPGIKVVYLEKPFTAARLLAVLDIQGDSFR